MENESITRKDIEEYIQFGMKAIRMFFGSQEKSVDELDELIDKAVSLSHSDLSDVEAIAQIGEGWTGDEAVAIAIYCTLRHFGDFESAIIAAVNHNGDSDSTGAVAGNIMGALVGYEAILQYYKDHLELHDELLRVAEELSET